MDVDDCVNGAKWLAERGLVDGARSVITGELMVAALQQKGTPVGYLLFSGEQHGFRKAESIKRALDAELYFYAVNVFGIWLSF